MKTYSKERYIKGAHTVLDLQYHFVWKSKYGYAIITGDIGLRLRSILKEICALHDIIITKRNVRANHVHMLVKAPSHASVSRIAQLLKGKSSYILQRTFPELKKRYWGQHIWSRGYFCATVGAVTGEIIKQYIKNQSDSPANFKVWDKQQDLSSSGSPLG
jgi:putative transposase